MEAADVSPARALAPVGLLVEAEALLASGLLLLSDSEARSRRDWEPRTGDPSVDITVGLVETRLFGEGGGLRGRQLFVCLLRRHCRKQWTALEQGSYHSWGITISSDGRCAASQALVILNIQYILVYLHP